MVININSLGVFCQNSFSAAKEMWESYHVKGCLLTVGTHNRYIKPVMTARGPVIVLILPKVKIQTVIYSYIIF